MVSVTARFAGTDTSTYIVERGSELLGWVSVSGLPARYTAQVRGSLPLSRVPVGPARATLAEAKADLISR